MNASFFFFSNVGNRDINSEIYPTWQNSDKNRLKVNIKYTSNIERVRKSCEKQLLLAPGC